MQRALFAGILFAVAMLAAHRPGDAEAALIRMPLAPLDVEDEPMPPVAKDLRVNVQNIAKLIKKGNAAAARTLAADAARQIEEFYDLDHMYRPRNKGGMGWSSKPGPIPLQDGLERQLMILSRNAPQNVLFDQERNIEAAYWIMAMADLTTAMVPKKNMGNRKTIPFWLAQSQALRESAGELRQAFAVNDAKAIKQSAAKVFETCTNCHVVFRD